MRVLQIAPDKEGNIKSIYDVKTGLDCECFCPICHAPLVAKNNGKNPGGFIKVGEKSAHFSHYDGSMCASAYESMLHLLAKQILQESKTLLIPSLIYKGLKIIQEAKIIFDKAEIEKEIESESIKIKPDLILFKDGKKLFVEILVSHKFDETKFEKIKMLNTSCIEIDISNVEPLVDGKLNIEGLKHIFENSNCLKYWILNSKSDELYEEKLKKEEEKLLKIKEEKFKRDEQERIERERKIREYDSWGNGLIVEGFEFLKIRETFQNLIGKKHNYSEICISVKCPKGNDEGIDNHIGLKECKCCKYHYKKIRKDFGWSSDYVICGFKNNLMGG